MECTERNLINRVWGWDQERFDLGPLSPTLLLLVTLLLVNSLFFWILSYLSWGNSFWITPNNEPPVTLAIKPIKANTTPDVPCKFKISQVVMWRPKKGFLNEIQTSKNLLKKRRTDTESFLGIHNLRTSIWRSLVSERSFFPCCTTLGNFSLTLSR